MLSALRRSRCWSSLPRKRPGRSPASWCREAAGPGGRYIAKQRLECVSVDFKRAVRVDHQSQEVVLTRSGLVQSYMYSGRGRGILLTIAPFGGIRRPPGTDAGAAGLGLIPPGGPCNVNSAGGPLDVTLRSVNGPSFECEAPH